MHHIKYLLLTFSFISFVACNSTKEPQTEEVKESNTSIILPKKEVLSQKEKIVRKELNAYLKELTTFNTDAIVDLTYPKLFYVIELDLFRQYLTSFMHSTDIKINSYLTNITKLSPVTTFSNGTEFAQADYDTTITIHFLNNEMYNNKEKINSLYDAFINKYSKENIHIDVKKRTIRIQEPKKLLIIKEKNTKWKFLGDDAEYRRFYPAFLPQEILNLL